MDYLLIATCLLLAASIYMKRDFVISIESRLGFLIIGSALVIIAFLLLYSFLREFASIFFFLCALFLFVGSLFEVES